MSRACRRRCVRAPNKPLHSVIIEQDFAKEEDVLPVLAEQFGMELVDLTKATVDPETLRIMPTKLVHRRNLMPLSRDERLARRRDRRSVRRLRDRRIANADRPARPSRAGQPARDHAGSSRRTSASAAKPSPPWCRSARRTIELLEELEADDSEIAKQAQEASVVKLVNEILIEAANEQASDIHIEPEENALRIRYRIDGLLQTQNLPPEINQLSVGDHQPYQDHGPAQHRREASAAGRPHQDARQQPRDRCPRLDHPDDPRRRHRHASARQVAHGVQPEERRHARRTPTSFSAR